MQVAPAAVAAFGQQETLPQLGHVGNHGFLILIKDFGAHRHPQDNVAAIGTGVGRDDRALCPGPATLPKPEFIDRYAIVDDEETCFAWLRAIEALGISKAILIGAASGVDVAEARRVPGPGGSTGLRTERPARFP